ncbi:MAG: type II toxin-antitoxin system VapC family toxin [Desulfovermiculus sp.]
MDTHTLLWWLTNDSKLSALAFEIIKAPHNAILVSSASGWEIATKYRLGKLSHAADAATRLPELLHKARMETLPMTMEHALAAGSLPGPHQDPFDRMLIAQGQIEDLPIVTSDPAFAHYSVELVW